MTIHPVPKPEPKEKRPRKRLQAKKRLESHKPITRKTAVKKVNKARLDKRTKRYKSYMSSMAWKLKRIACLTRDNWTCQACGWKDERACFLSELIAPRQLEADHLTYARFGHENVDDLLTLCTACHRRKHGMAPLKPRFLRAG
jgi:5-methylcytosine-specific restriction endonuclease McrA